MEYRRISYVLFLFSVLICSVAGHRRPDKLVATVHVANSMPRRSGPVQLRCNSLYKDHGIFQLHVGDDYKFGVRQKVLNYCEASFGNMIASWHAYEPRRDENHKVVYWKVKEDGFFLSWDNSTWVRKADWERE